MGKVMVIGTGVILGFIAGASVYAALAPKRSLPGDELGIGHELLTLVTGIVTALIGGLIGRVAWGKTQR